MATHGSASLGTQRMYLAAIVSGDRSGVPSSACDGTHSKDSPQAGASYRPWMPFPVHDSRIAASEKALGRRLPNGLSERLRQKNGGEIEAAGIVWYLHPILDDSDRRRLRHTGTNNIVHETEGARDAFKELFRDGAVAVANDGGGDYPLLLHGENEQRWWEPRTGNLEIGAD